MGVGVASAQKGKEQRKQQPVKVRIECNNLTTGESGRHISASTGDEVQIKLRIENRSGLAQAAVVNVSGGIPGCTVDETVTEFFELGQTKRESVQDVVPADQSGTLLIFASALMTKTGDSQAWDASVQFNLSAKSHAPRSPGLLGRIFARMMVRSLLTLSSDSSESSDKAAAVSMSQLKELYR
jgi:hypothetical protein